ncbi:unnamed protein product [Coccothraustes coccothraustes]
MAGLARPGWAGLLQCKGGSFSPAVAHIAWETLIAALGKLQAPAPPGDKHEFLFILGSMRKHFHGGGCGVIMLRSFLTLNISPTIAGVTLDVLGVSFQSHIPR